MDRFLADYGESCEAVADSLAPNGKAVFVVGRRFVGGHRLALDRFTADCLETRGMRVVNVVERALSRKRAPLHINRFGCSADEEVRKGGVIPTMACEIILVFRKSPA